MAYDRLIFRVHALRKMFERHITEEDVRHVLQTGEVIRAYPDDTPYPSVLMLGRCEGRPLHVVVADDNEGAQTIVITAYEPDPSVWETDFKRKKT